MKKLLLALILITLPLGTAFAEKKQGSGPNPYVECGIGAAIFPEVHWAAATSNVTWDLGSTALTSAISSLRRFNLNISLDLILFVMGPSSKSQDLINLL